MMIIFRQKEFARLNNISDVLDTATVRCCLEVMKCIEMFEVGGLRHWIGDKAVNQTISGLEDVDDNLRPQIVFCLAIEPNLSKNKSLCESIGNYNIITKYSKSPIDFINLIKNRLLTETKSGEAKYSTWFKENPIKYTSEEYVDFYKYISLCLSGQLNPEVDEFDWNIERVLRRYFVNYQIPAIKLSAKDCQQIIAICINNIVRRVNPNIKSIDSGFYKLINGH